MVKALNICGNIGEQQTLGLMEVILAGLKSLHKEYRAGTVILFASLIPRVRLNNKATKKILKSLVKVEKKDVETLSMLALLFRCQIKSIEALDVVKELINYRTILQQEVFLNTKKQVEEDQEFARRLLKTFALLCQKTLNNAPEPTQLFEDFLSLIFTALCDCRPSSDTAELLIACISSQFLLWKKQKKSVDEGELKKCLSLCKKILENLRVSFEEEYARKCTLQQESDVLFIEGVENPTAQMVAVKKILLDNLFVQALTAANVSDLEKDGIKSNRQAVKRVLSEETQFLSNQLTNEGLLYFCLNVLKLYPYKLKMVKDAIFHINAADKSSFPEKICVELLILQFLFTPVEKDREALNDVAQAVQGPFNTLANLLPTLTVVLKEESKSTKVIKRLFEKLRNSIKIDDLYTLSEQLIHSEVHRSAILFTLVISLLCKAVDETSEERLILQLVKVMLVATKWLPIRASNKEKEDDEDKTDSQYKHLISASELKAVPSTTMKYAVSTLCKIVNQDQVLLLALTGAVWQSKSVDPHLVSMVANFLKDKPEFSAALLSVSTLEIFSLLGGGDSGEEPKIVKHMHMLALDALSQLFETRSDVTKKIMSFESSVIPGLIGGLWSESKKVRKRTIKCFHSIMDKPVARANYAPLLKIIISQKQAILANPENLVETVKNFQEENRSFNVVMDALVDAALETKELLVALSPMFKYLSGKSLVQIALHLTGLLAKCDDDSVACKTLAKVLDQIGTVLMHHIDENPIWEFFESGLKSRSLTTFSHHGVDKILACAVIDTMKEYVDEKKEKSSMDISRVRSLVYALIELSKEDTATAAEHLASARTLLQLLLADNDIKVLEDIWGPGFFPSGKKSAPPAKATTLTDEKDKWQMTNFYLETVFTQLGQYPHLLNPLSFLLKRALHQQNQVDHSYTLDLLISALLEIVNTLDPEAKESNPMDSELIVQCIRGCNDPNTKVQALLLLAKSTVSSNVEYILHNSIQLFTFVGSHFLQMESKSSFNVACTAIDVLVPHILKAAQSQSQREEMSVNILNTFVDASCDIPRHRFCIFIKILIERLGADEYLWLLTLLLTKSEARKKHYDMAGGHHKMSKLTTEERLQQLIDLYSTFDSEAGLLLKSLRKMVHMTNVCNKSIAKLLGISEGKLTVEEAFDAIRIRMLSFIHKLFASQEFLRTVVRGLHDSSSNVQEELQGLLETIVLTMDKEEEGTKYRKHLDNCYEKVFESVLAIIPASCFVPILAQLIGLQQPSNIQRKALEVLNAKLNQHDQVYSNLEDILEALTILIVGRSEGVSAINQQIALLCVKTIAKNASNDQMVEKMKSICPRISAKPVLESFKEDPVIGAGILCITEVLQCLSMQGVVYLKSFVSWLLDLMSHKIVKSLVVLNSLVVAIQKLMDKFSGFLNPHYHQLVVASCQLSAWHRQCKNTTTELEFKQCNSRLRQLHLALANGIPFHTLLKIAPSVYNASKADPASIVALAAIMEDNVANVNKTEVLSSSTLSMEFFMEAFQYRQQSLDMVEEVEEALVATFLAFGLRLSLDEFKPMYYKLFNLALDIENLDGIATMFHLSSMVAKKLKSLFGFVCERIVQKATSILQECGKNKDDCEKKKNMLTYIFEALASIFKYNRVDSLLMKSYEDHVNAILDHLDGTIIDDTFLDKLKECLGELAATTEDETQWKYLNYQALMMIRNKSSKV